MLVKGRLIVGPLEAVRSKYSKDARAAFFKAQGELEEADQRVVIADKAVADAGANLTAADDVQDAAALDLAVKLVGDGFNRSNPFKAFDAKSPSELVNLGFVNEAKLLIALAGKVAQHPQVGAEAKKTASEMSAAAEAVRDAAKQQSKALKARSEAFAQRDSSLPEQWQQALTDLRTTLKYSDYVEHTTTYDEVFADVPKSEVVKKKKSAPVDDAVI